MKNIRFYFKYYVFKFNFFNPSPPPPPPLSLSARAGFSLRKINNKASFTTGKPMGRDTPVRLAAFGDMALSGPKGAGVGTMAKILELHREGDATGGSSSSGGGGGGGGGGGIGRCAALW